MKIDKKESYELRLDPAEMAVLGSGYCEVFPVSNMVWFHRQVVGNQVTVGAAIEWLNAVLDNPEKRKMTGVTAEAMLKELYALGNEKAQIGVDYASSEEK